MKKEILKVQEELAAAGLDALYVSSSDYHQSEYVNDHFHFREYLSNFNGSAGTVIVTKDAAGLWTDSRYFIAAAKMTEGTGITLYKQGLPGVPDPLPYLKEVLPEGARLGVDGRTINVNLGKDLAALMASKHGELVQIDMASKVWEGRPALTGTPIYVWDEKYAGRSAADKLADLRGVMAEKDACLHVISTLDDIAWLTNLRASDVAYTPMLISYMLVGRQQAALYALPGAAGPEIEAYLKAAGITLKDYDDFFQDLTLYAKDAAVLLDPSCVSYEIFRVVDENAKKVLISRNPTRLPKAVKNPTEVAGAKTAQYHDGIAMANFIYWVKQNVGKIPMTELSAAAYLEQQRRAQGAIGLSFETIAGYGANGAIVHYEPTPESDTAVEPRGFLLVDSGGQYLEGTTDITRTIAVGPLTKEERHTFTLVLKGHIQLALAKFPKGCTGENLDVLAHMPLWKEGLDYLHGTGHGVGALLSVHEGPNHFSWRASARGKSVPFEPGMITSNEPGYYKEGSHGVRLENLVLCVEKEETPYGKMYGFETMTLCPFEREAVETEILTAEELAWLNEYHEKVYQTFRDVLEPDVSAWLRKVTLPL